MELSPRSLKVLKDAYDKSRKGKEGKAPYILTTPNSEGNFVGFVNTKEFVKHLRDVKDYRDVKYQVGRRHYTKDAY